MRRLALLALLLTGCASSAPLTSVYVVRHAEKQGGEDPSLTEAGRARAEALARILAEVPLDAIYTTPLARNRQTSAPVAATQDVAPRVLAPEATAELAERIRTDHAGDRVLVVGHSNTIPDLLRLLGVTPQIFIEGQDYDDLFLVLRVGEQVRLEHLHYGAPSHPRGPASAPAP